MKIGLGVGFTVGVGVLIGNFTMMASWRRGDFNVGFVGFVIGPHVGQTSLIVVETVM
jgi:hypothetical protein